MPNRELRQAVVERKVHHVVSPRGAAALVLRVDAPLCRIQMAQQCQVALGRGIAKGGKAIADEQPA